MSSQWRPVEEALRAHHVRDVLVPGWIDRDGDVPEFRPQPMVVWLRLDDGFLRFESAGQYDRLASARVPAVSWADIGVLADAEDEVIVASYGEQLFGDGRSEWRCTRIRVYPGGGAECRCLALDFEGGHTLFLDPTWTFGIRLGNEAQEKCWVELYGDGACGVETTLVPGG
ncbi:hypothetical protein [Streptomyces scopuliridis]|uniref:Uncharacterized protein n=1 Tax=Streptomyces scopuliridis RB72 TaxID=1440053 RepID=A0A2T7TAD8_9ACTN|nr:hypothetical protein [Streptomyces scopuliridis]PVE12051.1 hypothetical protein Y717_06465 [Streptomyces scopuliridis RB72]